MNGREYKTSQKAAVLDFMRLNRDRQYSVNEIVENVTSEGVGKSTVYRLVSRLAEEGALRRFTGDDCHSAVYQYVGDHHECDGHFHLKCTGCGKLVHLDCGRMAELAEHIGVSHAFSIDMKKTVIYGTCAACAGH